MQADLSLRLEAQKTTDTGSNVRVSLLDARLHKECAVALGAGHSAMPEDVAQVAKEVQGVLEYLKLGFAPAVRLPEYYVLDFANAGRRIAVQIFDEAEFSIDARKVWLCVRYLCWPDVFAPYYILIRKSMLWRLVIMRC